jgi:HSP20 family protein
MTLLTTRRKNGSLLRDVVEDFFTPDVFSSMAPGFFTSLPNLVFDRMPNANISETETHYQIELAAPGLKKEDFELEIDNGSLMISVKKEESNEAKGTNFMRQEFSYESFSRSFYLPENVKVDKIDARYENGILKVVLPKSELVKKLPSKKLKVT